MTSINYDHYFDWAATAPADGEILRSALEQSLELTANPSSAHAAGIAARHALEDARKRCAKLLGVKETQIFFTSGGTESDQIPLLALLQRPVKGSIIISNIEHPAVREQAQTMKNCGWQVINAPSNELGIITADAVRAKLRDDTALVCIMAVNNETGAIQPVEEIAEVITEWGKGRKKPKFHVDGVQAVGKIPVNLKHPGIDSFSLSAHKIRGPRGIGLLYLKDRIEPFLRGGGQESGIRSGTENLFGALALASCLEKYAVPNPEQSEIAEHFVKKLAEMSYCHILPAGRLEHPELFSPGVVQASFDNIPGEVMVRALSEKGFYISTGSACSTRKLSRPILAAMGVSEDVAQNAVRFSFGSHTSPAAAEELLQVVRQTAEMFN
ncbi:MAG: cysteine desulfurase [Treponemataceae bacterium]|nr:cysteine desulfurase [Treponemataceae bacterium]